jgi:hypothetical protein
MGFADDAWLSGFADGEGCFLLYRRDEGFVPRFIIALRADDVSVLRAARDDLDAGNIIGETHPKASWVCIAKSDLLKIVAYFDRFPLRAKKSRDYAIWREAVVAYSEAGSRDPRLPDLYERLIDGRRFAEAG